MAKSSNTDPLVPASQVCEEFGISKVTLWRWGKAGVLPHPHVIMGRKYYLRSALDKLRADASQRVVEQPKSLALKADRLRDRLNDEKDDYYDTLP